MGGVGRGPQGGLPSASARPGPAAFSHAERKHVTILFADITGATQLIQSLDPEQGLELLEPTLLMMQTAVHEHGGTVLGIEGDGIMAMFGAPLAAEDHALRACAAASAMLASLRAGADRGRAIRIGIDTGEVVLQSVSDGIAFEYRASGALTHLAHRLQEVAEAGAAYLSLATLRLAGPGVKARRVGALPMKGFDAPVEVFALEEVRDITGWDRRRSAGLLSRFVGRASEQRMLEQAAGRAASGRGSAIAIVGEAGIGKSRLVHELHQGLSAGEWRAAWVAGSQAASGTPFGVAADLVRSAIGAGRGEEQGAVRARLERTLQEVGADGADQLWALHALLDLPFADQRWAEAAPQLRQQQIVTAVREVVLRTASRTPTVVIAEDMHWVDRESAAILEMIAAAAGSTGLLLIATGRPEWTPGWTDGGDCALIRLGSLEDADARALLADVLGEGAELNGLADRLIEQSEGVPLFLEEMVRHLIERGVLVPERARLLLARPVQEIEIPESVVAILEARIGRLAPAERALLQLASVIGRRVAWPLLAAVAGLRESVLEQRLAVLRRLEFLDRMQEPGAEYIFTHALTQAAAYGGILTRRRRELHRQVLEAFEQVYAERIGEYTEILAEHAFSGEAWAKAARYSLQGGQAANGVAAHHAAIRFFERALAALDRLERSEEHARLGIEARMGLRVALASTAELRRIRDCLAEADRLAEEIGDRRELVKIRSSGCTVWTVLGEMVEAVAAGEWAYAASRSLDDDALRLVAAFALAQAQFVRGELRRAEAILVEHLALLLGPYRRYRTGTTGTLSVLALTTLVIVRTLRGDRAGAAEAAGAGMAIAGETRLAYDLSYGLVGDGLAALANGRAEQAVAALDEALRHCREARLEILFPSVSRFLGQAYTAAGRAAEVVPTLREAVARSRLRGLGLFQAWCGVTLGFALLQAGASEAAREAAREAVELARERGLLPILVPALRLAGRVAEAEGEVAAAAARYQEAAAMAERLGMAPELAQCRAALAGLGEGGGEGGGARAGQAESF